MKRAASALPNAGKADKPRKVEVIRTTYKPSCIREAGSRAFAMLPVLDAVESGLRFDAEHWKSLCGAMAGRSTPRVPLSPT